MATADNSRNSLDWNGTYTGIIPCADCEGIETMIQLNRDSTYILETNYIGKSNGLQQQKGSFHWNQAGNKITLSEKAVYAVGENKITQLDINGNAITGKLSDRYILKKNNSGIVEKYWKLIELNGKTVGPPDNAKREAHLILKAAAGRVIGHGGCNSFTGNYELPGGNRISFSKIAATKMACLNLETEIQLFRALEMADNYTTRENTLLLNKAKMAPLAKFEVVYMK